jgi:hypothetical protein
MDGAPSEACSTTTILARLSIERDAGAGAVHTITSAAGLPSLTYSRTIRDDQNRSPGEIVLMPTAQTSIPSSRSSPSSKTHCAKWHAEPSMHSGTQSELPSMTFPQKNASTIFAMPDMGPPNQDTL